MSANTPVPSHTTNAKPTPISPATRSPSPCHRSLFYSAQSRRRPPSLRPRTHLQLSPSPVGVPARCLRRSTSNKQQRSAQRTSEPPAISPERCGPVREAPTHPTRLPCPAAPLSGCAAVWTVRFPKISNFSITRRGLRRPRASVVQPHLSNQRPPCVDAGNEHPRLSLLSVLSTPLHRPGASPASTIPFPTSQRFQGVFVAPEQRQRRERIEESVCAR